MLKYRHIRWFWPVIFGVVRLYHYIYSLWLRAKYKPQSPKVFGIGYNKTGTMSLHFALRRMGYRSVHWMNGGCKPPIGWIRYIKRHKYDAISDMPVCLPGFFKVLDKEFPNSKFVLTIRDEKKWEKSIVRFFKLSPWEVNTEEELIKWREDQRRHIKDVKAYFKNRPNDLLIMDITKGDGYEQLCPFIGREIPKEPFPHKNKHISVPLIRP